MTVQEHVCVTPHSCCQCHFIFFVFYFFFFFSVEEDWKKNHPQYLWVFSSFIYQMNHRIAIGSKAELIKSPFVDSINIPSVYMKSFVLSYLAESLMIMLKGKLKKSS